jgi:16S rRNA (cytidine1402-2'-O)-methyltransferase
MAASLPVSVLGMSSLSASAQPGTLYMVATPIGNLEDITLRAARILGEVDAVYAEDTRVSGKLLAHLGVKKPLRSYREALEGPALLRAIENVKGELAEGKSLAYVSDAGTPGISDPGSYLVRNVVAAGFTVVPLPGPSSLVTLLSAAGFAAQRPLFVGFLPKKKGHQTLMGKLRASLENETADAVVFMESPERIIKLMEELEAWSMPLQACLGRELSKLHEEFIRGTPAEVLQSLRTRPSIKGEIVLAIELAR